MVLITRGVTLQPNQKPQPRREIHNLIADADKKQFSLYIQALISMANVREGDPTSWFGLASIHGAPYERWGGDIHDGHDAPDGYCHHGTTLFPTWHRPYMLLFEQVLSEHAVNIAKQYTTDVDEWKKAAESLRTPYWDWASNPVPAPELINYETHKELSILGAPNASPISVPNPLLGYHFQGPVHSDFGSFDRFPFTLRHPTADHKTDIVKMTEALGTKSYSEITKPTYDALTLVHDWRGMSNHTEIPDSPDKNEPGPDTIPRNANALETLHDDLHIKIGGSGADPYNTNPDEGPGGHMCHPLGAAFDPIFWLHHANIDRLFVLWSKLHPGVWVTPGKGWRGAKYHQTAEWLNHDLNVNTELAPFVQGSKETPAYFTSDERSLSPHALGYTYDDTEVFESMDPKEAVKRACEYVHQKYGPQDPSQDLGPVQWSVRLRVDPTAFKQSFVVFFFIGEPPSKPEQFRTDPSFAGSQGFFVNSAVDKCGNCAAQKGLRLEAFVELTSAMNDLHVDPCGDTGVCRKKVKDTLQWRVQTVDGLVVPNGDQRLQSLETSVLRIELESARVRPEIGLLSVGQAPSTLPSVKSRQVFAL